MLVLNSTAQIEAALEPGMKVRWQDVPNLIDFAFIALHGGAGENGQVQGALEMLGIPYNGSRVLSSALCMDKFKTTEFLRAQGFDVPRNRLVSKQQWLLDAQMIINELMEQLPMPMIVKPHDDGCSVMVQKVRTADQLRAAVDAIFEQAKEYALVEECVSGMELTIGVVGNEKPMALIPSQAVCAADILSIEEKFLPGAGENQTPAPLPQSTLRLVQRTMENVYSTLECKGYARIDCFYQTADQSPTSIERVVTLEVNTLPGLTPATCIFHQAAEYGMKPMDFIDLIVALGFEEHQKPEFVAHSSEHLLESYKSLR